MRVGGGLFKSPLRHRTRVRSFSWLVSLNASARIVRGKPVKPRGKGSVWAVSPLGWVE